jgi:hypothetical protein
MITQRDTGLIQVGFGKTLSSVYAPNSRSVAYRYLSTLILSMPLDRRCLLESLNQLQRMRCVSFPSTLGMFK